MVELLGLWAPRIHLPVERFESGSLPAVSGGRRERCAGLLRALIAKCPRAWQRGLVTQALNRAVLDGAPPLAAHDHKRLVRAWLTSERLWPSAARG